MVLVSCACLFGYVMLLKQRCHDSLFRLRPSPHSLDYSCGFLCFPHLGGERKRERGRGGSSQCFSLCCNVFLCDDSAPSPELALALALALALVFAFALVFALAASGGCFIEVGDPLVEEGHGLSVPVLFGEAQCSGSAVGNVMDVSIGF